MTKGKCPACNRLINRVFFDSVNVMPSLFSEEGWKGITYLCPHCHAVLGVGIDPVALKSDTVSDVAAHVDQAISRVMATLSQIANYLHRKG